MKPIDNYMTVSEAAYKWGIPVDTVKNRLKPSVKSNLHVLDQLLRDGHIKYFQRPEGKLKEWIITKQAMEIWFKNY